MRELIYKSNPGLESDNNGGGRTIKSALPTEVIEEEKSEKSDTEKSEKKEEGGGENGGAQPKYLPPTWAFEVEEEAEEEKVDEIPIEAMVALFQSQLPFKDDMDVLNVMRRPHADEVLRSLLDANMPERIARSTENSAYADYLVTSMFSDFYIEDHTIPANNITADEMITLPYVPKKMVALLQVLAVNASYKNPDFDLNTFWGQVRNHFPDVVKSDPSTKPTASQLLQEAHVAVNEEEMAAKVQAEGDKQGYDRFRRLMAEYNKSSSSSSGEETMEEPPQGQIVAPEGATKDVAAAVDESKLDSTMDTTSIELRSHTVTAVKSTEAASGSGQGMNLRKRTTEEIVKDNVMKIRNSKAAGINPAPPLKKRK